jgi:hypothetical protein
MRAKELTIALPSFSIAKLAFQGMTASLLSFDCARRLQLSTSQQFPETLHCKRARKSSENPNKKFLACKFAGKDDRFDADLPLRNVP